VYSITADDQSVIEKQAFLLTISNGSEYGNGAKIAPKAKVNDGLLDIIVLKPFKALDFIMIPYRFFSGTLHLSPRYQSMLSKKILIDSKDKVAQLDGEPIIVDGACEISIQKQSLKIMVP